MELNTLILFGGLLLAGVVGSTLASRTRVVPGITGMIVAGLILGPEVTGLLSHELLADTRIFIDIALGIILFDLGLVLDVRSLWRERLTLLAAALEAVATFFAIFLGLQLVQVEPLYAALAAAVGVSSSPAVLLLVVRELNAKGPVTDLSLKLVALNNIIAFLLYSALLPIVHVAQAANVVTVFLQPLLELAGSAGLALVMAFLLVRFSRWLLSPGTDPFPLVVGFILLTLGLARMLALSPLLALLALGLLVRNLDTREHLAQVQFGRGGDLFFLILFVLAGANLHLDALATMAGAAVVFVATRFGAKWLVLFAMGKRIGMSSRQSASMGLTLLPMAGLAIGLVQSTSMLYPGFSEKLSAIVLAAVAILETIGPIATEFALKKAGEVDTKAVVQH